MSNLKPFVKWVGGKRQIIDILQNHLPEQYDRYFEPFIGGGALLFHVQPKKATVNDINQQLINAYQWIKFDVELVIRLLCIF
nr:MAG TPA: cytosine DNA methyltransferase [Caudoviricetes sp.]